MIGTGDIPASVSGAFIGTFARLIAAAGDAAAGWQSQRVRGGWNDIVPNCTEREPIVVFA